MAVMLIWTVGVVFWIAMIIALIVLLVKLLKGNSINLHKSTYNRKICGVCGGLGEAFGIDATLIRILWIIFTICGGSGIIAYIVAALIMPKDVNVVG